MAKQVKNAEAKPDAALGQRPTHVAIPIAAWNFLMNQNLPVGFTIDFSATISAGGGAKQVTIDEAGRQ